MMNILHIASIDNNKANGVSIVVPEHVNNQGKLARVALLNCSDVMHDIQEENIHYEIYNKKHYADGNINNMPEPFNNPDIVVFHGIYFYYFIKVARYLTKQNIPYVIAPHGSLTSFAQQKKYVKKLFGNFLYFNKFVKNSSALQYLTLNEQQMSSAFNNKFFISGNGVYIKDIGVSTIERGNKEGFELTFIGRLDPFHKGLDILIEACNKISTEMRRCKIHLSIFGPDQQDGRKTIKKMVQDLGLGDIISIGEALYGIEKQKQLKNTDIFILTSRFEGQPLAAMEALAMGLPVLLTPGTNIAGDVTKYKCGWKAEFSAESVAEQIIEAYNSKGEMSIYSENALKMVKSNYAWDYIAEKNIMEFENVLTKKVYREKGFGRC
ncbi:glycosyltransferase [Candidatus Pristimantibacillus sp. PTI5]|uniref:glycosyltransferase n=1 Tax=Candidatus Pristimantibacillus sp. PTI5 TaxID=3400422 RepID=UPI003B018518